MKKRLSKRKKIIFAIVIFFIITVILEIGLSLFSYFYYPRLTISDQTLGWKYKPTTKPVTRHFSEDIVYTININNEGFRDAPFIEDPNTYRVMVLGDSFTFGMEVDEQQVFCNLVEEKIKKDTKRNDIDIMNFGITGFGTCQQFLCLQQYAKKYPPNMVVLVLFEGNDFNDNINSFSAGRYRPHFTLQNDDITYINNPSMTQNTLTFLRDHSTLFFGFSNYFKITNSWLTQNYDVNEEHKIKLTQKLLQKINTHCEQQNIPFALIYLKVPNLPDTPYTTIEKWAKNNSNISFAKVLLIPEIRVHKVGHMNHKGHKQVADLLYPVILENIERQK